MKYMSSSHEIKINNNDMPEMCVKFIFTVANYGPFAFWITSVFAINHCRLIPGAVFMKGLSQVLSLTFV